VIRIIVHASKHAFSPPIIQRNAYAPTIRNRMGSSMRKDGSHMIQVAVSNKDSVGTNGIFVNGRGAKIKHNSRPLLAASAWVVFQYAAGSYTSFGPTRE